METEMAEKLNITHHYDKNADILYIDFGSDEPCFTEDVDGLLMLEIGWFSNLPRGIRVISPKLHKVKSVEVLTKQIEKAMDKRAKQIEKDKPILRTNLGQKLGQALAGV